MDTKANEFSSVQRTRFHLAGYVPKEFWLEAESWLDKLRKMCLEADGVVAMHSFSIRVELRGGALVKLAYDGDCFSVVGSRQVGAKDGP